MLSILSLAIVGLIAGGTIAKPPSRINGGYLPQNSTLKHIVAIYENGYQVCGGAIISEKHILTAGHCGQTNEIGLTVAAGLKDFADRSRHEYTVAKVIQHPQYVPASQFASVQNDIEILVLAEKLPLGGKLEKIELASALPIKGLQALIAGYGFTTSTSDTNSKLLELPIVVLNQHECQLTGGLDTLHTFCGYTPSGSICPGDSGSPLIAGGRVIGIASTSTCEPARAHNYVDVFSYRDWILKAIKSS